MKWKPKKLKKKPTLKLNVKKKIAFSLKKKRPIDDMIESLVNTMVPATQLYAKQVSEKHKAKRDALKKQIHIDVSATGVGCQDCLARPAAVFHPSFEMNLCLECKDRLEMALAAETADRLSRQKT